MEIRTPFERLLAYDHWANGQALATVEALEKPPAKALGILGHFLGAEECWLHRMVALCDPADVDRLDDVDAATLRRVWREELPALWSSFLRDAAKSDVGRTFTYVNYLGETRSCGVQDAVLGLMLHSAHHRGQVASLVRAAGGTPAVTDFIHATRVGAVP